MRNLAQPYKAADCGLLSERAISAKFKIQPTECRVGRESDAGVCMFNYECYKQKGTVLGTCIDGFLFGACCRLPSALGTLETIDKEEEGGMRVRRDGGRDGRVKIVS